MDKDKNFYFLEMNTRLQVEHPVTEFITGLDLVQEQISIAEGNKLSLQQENLNISGHAIECRIYAEDANNNFLPSVGKIFHYKSPSGPGVRLDSGFEEGAEISIYYDPLISKLVIWGKNRKIAIKRMLRALREYQIAGVTTNISFLENILQHQAIIKGNFDINFVENDFLKNKISDKNSIETNEAAALLTAILKNNSSKIVKSTKNISKSSWQEQIYE